MDHSNVWVPPRYFTLLVVLGVHAALLAALVLASRTLNIIWSTNHPIELLFLPPAAVPPVRSKNPRPLRLSGDSVIAIAPPVPDASVPSASPPASATDGNGSGSDVDWAAEARRALQAYEIRKHQPAKNITVSGSPAEESWWPAGRHRAGDQYKTSNGDWIVWIDASCYQVANSAATTTLGSLPPRTICPRESSATQ